MNNIFMSPISNISVISRNGLRKKTNMHIPENGISGMPTFYLSFRFVQQLSVYDE